MKVPERAEIAGKNYLRVGLARRPSATAGGRGEGEGEAEEATRGFEGRKEKDGGQGYFGRKGKRIGECARARKQQ
jgi:hypothetical protein